MTNLNQFTRQSAAVLLACGLIAGLLPFFATAQDGSTANDKKSRPNVVFIYADDLGWGDLGCYGNPQLKTPNLDKMAASGVLLTHYYSASSVCSPSRAAIMTGLFPARVGFHTATADALDKDLTVVPRLFQQNGYKTAHFGKWHMGVAEGSPPPTEYGIDESLGYLSTGPKMDAPRHESSEKLVDQTIDFIEKYKNESFYVHLWTLVPHTVLSPTEKQMEPYNRYRPSRRGADPMFRSTQEVYYGSVTDMDYHIGRLVDKIDELGLTENTIIIFSSDNGPEDIHLGIAGHSGIGSPGPFRGRKRSIYEGGIRVPFIIRWGSHLPNGFVNDVSIVGAVDYLPSLCRLAGIPLPNDYKGDGQDMSQALMGKPVQRTKPLMWEWRFKVFGYTFNQSPRLALRDGKWKFLMNPDGSRIELYDFEADPLNMEMDNVADRYPDVVKKYSAVLTAFSRSLPPGESDAEAGTMQYPMPKNSK